MANMDKFFSAVASKPAQSEPKQAQESESSSKPEEKKESQSPIQTESQKQEEIKKKKFNVKVYGKEKEVEVGDDEIPVYLQKALSADEKWKQTVEKERQIAEREEKIKAMEEFMEKNPDMFLRQKWGPQKAQEYYEQQVLRQMELERMSPEQREEYQLKERLNQLREEARKEEERYSQIEAERQEKMFSQYFSDMAKRHLEKAGFPEPSNLVWNKFIMMMRSYLGHSDAQSINEDEVSQIAQMVRDDTKSELSGHIQSLPVEEIKELLGPKLEEIRKMFLVNKPIANAPEVLSQDSQDSQPSKKKLTPQESREFWRNLNR